MTLVPPGLAASPILRQAGEAGLTWLRGLDGQVAACCARWDLTPDGPALHGALSLALPVERGTGPLVLRLSWPAMPLAHEVTALRIWDGRGAVLLMEADLEGHALLLERLDHSRTLNGRPIGEALAVAGGLLRRLAVPAPDGLPSVADWTRDFARRLDERWQDCGRPFEARLLDRARELAGELGRDPARLLINDDLHYRDVMAGGHEPWLAIDPQVIVGRPEMAVARLLWTRLEDLLTGGGLTRHFAALVDAAGLEGSVALGWTLLRCLDYWLWGLEVGLTIDPERCRAIVDWVEEHPDA